MKRILIFLPLIVLCALLALLANRLSAPRMTGTIDSPLIGKALPDIGAQIPAHIPVVINFFASWCAPCAIENPTLMHMKANGITIIGIAFKDTPEAIEKWLKQKGNPYAAVLYDSGNGASINMGITGVPESFAIDADRIVRARIQGPLEDPQTVAVFMKALEP